MAYLTFHKWLVYVYNIHNDIWMVQTKTSHLGKVSYAIILLGWRYTGTSGYYGQQSNRAGTQHELPMQVLYYRTPMADYKNLGVYKSLFQLLLL